MSKKKRTTKSSVSAKAVAAFAKAWGRNPDRADKRFYMARGRWPSQAEFAFWDKEGRFPKPGELARLTREKKKRATENRRAAAKRAAEKRRQKSPEVRAWEQARKALQAAQKEDVERASAKGIKRPLRAHRWYDFFYISLSRMSEDEVHGLLMELKKRGVQTFRIEREVPVGEYTDPNDVKTASGFISTKFQFMGRLSNTDLRYGNSKTGLPSLSAMRNAGIDFMRYLVIDDTAIRDNFPRDLRRDMFKLKRETRETIKDADEQINYLTKGTKFTAAQKRMNAQRKAIDADLEDEDEEDEAN